jgi:hypothetical protein
VSVSFFSTVNNLNLMKNTSVLMVGYTVAL